MCNGNIQLSISRLGQTGYFRVFNRGKGFVAGEGVTRGMEAVVGGRTVRTFDP